MDEYITLIGAEDIRSAANTMANAAIEMQKAMGNLAFSLARHQCFMDDWLRRFETVLEKLPQQRNYVNEICPPFTQT